MLNRNTFCSTYHRLLGVGVGHSIESSQFLSADAPAAPATVRSLPSGAPRTVPPKISAFEDRRIPSPRWSVPHYRVADCLVKWTLGVKRTLELKTTWALGVLAVVGCSSQNNTWSVTEKVYWINEFERDLGALVVSGGSARDTVVLTGTKRQGSAGTGRGFLFNVNSDDPSGSVERLSCKSEHCNKVSTGAAYWGGEIDGDADDCFTLGVSASDSGQDINLWCRNGGEQVRAAPSTESMLPVPQLVFGSDTGTRPGFLASWVGERRFWYFPGNGDEPSEHVAEAASASKSWGESIAVLPLGTDQYSSRIVAIGARDEGEVWIYRSEFPYPGELKRVACLGPLRGLGRKLIAGDLDGDLVGDLLVVDDTHVTAFSGKVLAVLGPQAETSCDIEALPAGAIIASVSCASGDLTSGCEDADFGASVVIADLDGDDDGEIVVGAPGMNVLEDASVGAVLIYDAEGDDPNALTEQLVLTDLEPDARFGAGIGVAKGRNSDHLLVGAPGFGRLGIAPCFEMTRAELRPKWCPESE